MPFWSVDTLSSAPLYGDSYIRRPSTSISSRRKSAPPPRPPRPELYPWPKELVRENVVEIVDDVEFKGYDGGAVDIRVSRHDFADPYHPSHYGRVSPVSPLSEEGVSSVGSNNSHTSPFYSLKKDATYLVEPQGLRRRPFSFESMRSTYSQRADMKPEQLQVPYQPAQIYDEYAEIARSNPFQNEAESVLGRSQRDIDEDEFEFHFGLEPSRRSSQAAPSVPMSRYNTRRVPPPSPDPDETLRQLDEAWEEVKRAVAPKLKIASTNSSPSSSKTELSAASMARALPPSPPPPPIPPRNPLRARVEPPKALNVDPRRASKRLSHSTSSPSMNKAYRRSQMDMPPPVPPMPIQIPAPIPASNLPVNAPTALPTPAASDCSSDSNASTSPVSPLYSTAGASSRSSGSKNSSISSINSSNGNRLPLSPVTEPSSTSSASPKSWSEHSVVSPLSSPTGRGFHEPPPVMPTPRPISKRHSSAMGRTTSHNRGWSDSKVGFSTAIWAGSTPPSSYDQMHQAPLIRSNTLRSIAPGESAARTSYQPPVQSMLTSQIRESVVAGTNGSHVLQGSQRVATEQFEPIKIIPLPEKQKTGSSGEYMPRFSNNFAGFCKGAWRLQTAQTNKAFSLRTTHRKTALANSTTTHTKTTTLKCGKCSFEGALARHPATLAAAANYAPSIDYLACADKTPRTAHGVVYRWSFLFKSHVPCRSTLRKDEVLDVDQQVYACLFCCSEAKGTLCFRGVASLCGHIAREHAGGVDLAKELKQRVGIIVSRSPAKNEDWDIILPGQVWV